MSIAIETKFLPCTNTKGDRIKAICEFNSITLAWDDGLTAEENHRQAALELINTNGGESENIITGSLKNSYVHVKGSK